MEFGVEDGQRHRRIRQKASNFLSSRFSLTLRHSNYGHLGFLEPLLFKTACPKNSSDQSPREF